MAGENNNDPFLTKALEWQSRWRSDIVHPIADSVNAKTFFELGSYAYNGESFKNDLKPEDLPLSEKKTYDRFKELSDKVSTELVRGKNGGYLSLSVLQYMVDHPAVSMIQALDPAYDIAGKRVAGEQILSMIESVSLKKNAEGVTVSEESLKQNRAIFGKTLAKMTKRLVGIDLVGEIRTSLGLPKDASQEEFLAKMESPEGRLILPNALKNLSGFTQGVIQVLAKAVPGISQSSVEDRQGARKKATTPESKAVYQAFYDDMTDEDLDTYKRWHDTRKSIMAALLSERNCVEDMKRSNVKSAYLVASALARREIARAGSFSAISPLFAESLANCQDAEIPGLTEEEIRDAVIQGLSSERAEQALVGLLPEDDYVRTYFGALTKKDQDNIIITMARLGSDTGLSSLDSLATGRSIINMMMILDGHDIAQDILPDTPEKTGLKREYARKYWRLVETNPFEVKQINRSKTVNLNAVKNFADIYVKASNYFADFRFPNDFSNNNDSPDEQIEILKVAESMANDIGQAFGDKFCKTEEYLFYVGGPGVHGKYADTLLDFQAISHVLAERNTQPNPAQKIVLKLQSDFVNKLVAGKTIAELHSVYPPGYLAEALFAIKSNFMLMQEAIDASEKTENQAQIQAFLDGGPLPSFMNREMVNKVFSDAFEYAKQKRGIPSGDLDSLISVYTEQPKLNPLRDYNCIPKYVEVCKNGGIGTELAMTLFTEALTQATGSMTSEQAKAMFPEELIEILMVESVTEIQTAIAKKLSLLDSDSPNITPEAALRDCLAGGPLPDFIDKKDLDDALKTAIDIASTEYKNKYGVAEVHVRPLVISDRADRLSTMDTDYLYFGAKTKQQVEALGNDLSKQHVQQYFPTLGRSLSRASIAVLSMFAAGGDVAEAVFLDTPEANSLKAEHGAVVKDMLLNHPPILKGENDVDIPQTENIKWYAELYDKSSDYIMNAPVPEVLNYSDPKNAAAKKRTDILHAAAQDFVQVLASHLPSLEAFKIEGKDTILTRDRIGDFAVINDLVADWNNPQKPLIARMCDKIVADTVKDAVCGKSILQISQSFPTGYFYSISPIVKSLVGAELGRIRDIPAKADAIEQFLSGGKLPDFVSKERLEALIDDAQKAAKDAIRGENKSVEQNIPDLKMFDYEESNEVSTRRAASQIALHNILDKLQNPQVPQIEKGLIRMAVDSLGMSVEEACRRTSSEYVAKYLSAATTPIESLHGEVILFDEVELNAGVASNELQEFLNGEKKLPFALAKYEARIQDFFTECGKKALNEANDRNPQQLRAALPVRFPAYEKCPTPPELVGLDFLADEAATLTVAVNANYRETLFEIDVKRLTVEAIRDGSKAFDEMIASQFPGLNEIVKNPAVAREKNTPAQLFFIDGIPAEKYIRENVDDIGVYSAAEKDIICKVGIMQALTNGEHIVEVMKPGIVKGQVTAKLQRVGMNLSVFKGLEKWYQPSRVTKQARTDSEKAEFIADAPNREKAIADELHNAYVAIRDVPPAVKITEPVVDDLTVEKDPITTENDLTVENNNPAPVVNNNPEPKSVKQKLLGTNSPAAKELKNGLNGNKETVKKSPDVISQTSKKEKTNNQPKN